jgi:hypothetical protein
LSATAALSITPRIAAENISHMNVAGIQTCDATTVNPPIRARAALVR